MKKVFLLTMLFLFSFVTAEVQLEEGFENGVPPDGWTMVDNDGDTHLWSAYEASAHSGAYSAASASWISHKKNIFKEQAVDSKDALTPDNYLITPLVSIPAEGAMLTFWAAAQDDDYLYEHFEVMVSSASNSVEDFVDPLYAETISVSGWHQVTVGLADYAGTDIYLAIVHNNCTDAFILKIDDLKIESTTPSPEFSIDYQEMDFGLIVVDDESSENFEIMNIGGGVLVINDGDISLSGTDASEFEIEEIAYPVNLANSEKLNFRVDFRPQSAGEKVAVLQIEDNISKELHTIQLSGSAYQPYADFSEDFDQIEAPLLPDGWSKILISNSSWAKIKTNNESVHVLSSPNSLELDNGDDGAGILLAILPKLSDFGLNQLDFWARESQGNGLIVGTMSDPEDATSFTPFTTISLTSEYVKYQILFDSYTGTDQYIALKHGQTSLYSSIYVDDLQWHSIPDDVQFAISPAAHDFDVVTVGNVVEKNFTITNIGSGVLEIQEEGIMFTGTDSELFALAAPVGTIELASQESTVITVSFAPLSAGVKTANLVIVDNAKGINTIELLGEGFVLPPGLIEIGSGSQIEQHLPLEPYFSYSYSQSVFLQEEINITDKRIKSVFYHYNGNSGWSDNIELYMGHSSLSQLSDWLSIDELVKVFEGQIVVPHSKGWVEIVLDMPFIYNNSDNLIVALRDKGSGYHLVDDEFYCSSSGSINMSIEAHRDGSQIDPLNPPAIGSGQYNATLRKFRPNIRFMMEEIPERNVELNVLIPSAVGEAGTNLDYIVEVKNTGQEEDIFDLQYYDNNWPVQLLDKEGLTPISMLPLAGLGKDSIIARVALPAEAVEGEIDTVFVKAISQGDPAVSDFGSAITTVIKAITEFPYSQNFEGGIIPLSWENPFGLWYIGSEASSGSYCAQTNFDHDGDAILMTPKITLLENQEIEFWWIDKRLSAKTTNHDTTYFEISSDAGSSWNSLSHLSSISGMDNYVKEIVDLSTYAGSDIWLRWRHITDASSYSLGCGLDDIIIRDIVIDEEAPEFVSIRGTEAYDSQAMNIDIEVLDDSDLIDPLTATCNIDDDEFTINLNLIEAVKRSDGLKNRTVFHYSGTIDPGYTADTTGTISFVLQDVYGNTAEEEIHVIKWIMPPVFEQSFEGEFPPEGWQVKFNTTDDGGLSGVNLIDPPISNPWEQTDHFDYVYDGLSAAYISHDAPHFNWLITPEIELKNGMSSLNFWIRYFSGEDEWGSFWTTKFHLLIKVENETDWLPIAAFVDESYNNIYDHEVVLDLEDYLAKKIKIAFVHEHNDGFDVAVDFVRIFSAEESSVAEYPLPDKTTLFQNYPNPFNPSTRIDFYNKVDGAVQLSIYNAKGQLVARPLNKLMKSGLHSISFDGSILNSGLYFYLLKTTDVKIVKKMMIIK